MKWLLLLTENHCWLIREKYSSRITLACVFFKHIIVCFRSSLCCDISWSVWWPLKFVLWGIVTRWDMGQYVRLCMRVCVCVCVCVCVLEKVMISVTMKAANLSVSWYSISVEDKLCLNCGLSPRLDEAVSEHAGTQSDRRGRSVCWFNYIAGSMIVEVDPSVDDRTACWFWLHNRQYDSRGRSVCGRQIRLLIWLYNGQSDRRGRSVCGRQNSLLILIT